jgi:hypothetical protein
MNKTWRRVAPWAAAWAAPSVALAVLLLVTGQGPAAAVVYGVAYGWAGALGAVTFAATRSWLRYRTALALLRELEPAPRSEH